MVAWGKIKIRTPISTEPMYHLCTAVQSKSLRLGTACNLLKPHRLWELPCSSAEPVVLALTLQGNSPPHPTQPSRSRPKAGRKVALRVCLYNCIYHSFQRKLYKSVGIFSNKKNKLCLLLTRFLFQAQRGFGASLGLNLDFVTY